MGSDRIGPSRGAAQRARGRTYVRCSVGQSRTFGNGGLWRWVTAPWMERARSNTEPALTAFLICSVVQSKSPESAGEDPIAGSCKYAFRREAPQSRLGPTALVSTVGRDKID